MVTVVVVEDMDGDTANSCFEREGAGSDVQANFEHAEQAGVEFVD